MRKAVISGGGTGGHVYPGLAIAQILKENGFETSFIGTRKGLESKIVPDNGYAIYYVNIKGFKGKSALDKIFALLLLPFSVIKALVLLLKLQPEFVIITGGYVSLPVALASFILFKKLYLQEQNAFPGLVNRISSKFARFAFTGFRDKAGIFGKKEIFTGNPVRKEFLEIPKLQVEDRSFHLLITGGSQGSFFINSLIDEVVLRLQEMDIEIIHLTGERWIDQFTSFKSDKYKPIGYSTDIAKLVQWSDLVISRAGASMLAELGAAGRPAILIPLAVAADNHQYFNGLSFVDAKAGIMIEEKNASAASLYDAVENIIKNRMVGVEMGLNAKNVFPLNSTELITKKILEENN